MYRDGHCYITNCGAETFKIAMNLPGAEELISFQIRYLMSQYKQHDDSVVPQILGYQLQSDFYAVCKKAEKFKILYCVLNNNKSIAFNINLCTDFVSNLHVGVLYRLIDTHPAIDFIGDNVSSISQPLCQP